MSERSVTVDDVTVSMGDDVVLSGVDARFTPGSFTGIVGPNGAGKTTLLRTIAGIHARDSGEVVVDGRPLDSYDPRERARTVAYLPQESSVSFDYTARQIVAMGRYPYQRRTPGDDVVRRAMETTETVSFADRPVGELSSGERRRVLLARCLAQDTPVTMLDEPTANLDVHHAARMLDIAERLVDEGRTVIAVLHDLETALRVCDRAVMLSEGTVVHSGPPERVVTEDAIESVYGQAVVVGEDAVTGEPTVSLRRDGRASEADAPSPAIDTR